MYHKCNVSQELKCFHSRWVWNVLLDLKSINENYNEITISIGGNVSSYINFWVFLIKSVAKVHMMWNKLHTISLKLKRHEFDEIAYCHIKCFFLIDFLKHYVFILWIKDKLHVLILIFNYTVIDFFYSLTGSGLGLGRGRSRINGGHKTCSFPFIHFKSYMYVSLNSIR